MWRKSFNYIPALNDDQKNIEAMEKIILDEISSWDNIHLNSDESLMITKNLFDKHYEHAFLYSGQPRAMNIGLKIAY